MFGGADLAYGRACTPAHSAGEAMPVQGDYWALGRNRLADRLAKQKGWRACAVADGPENQGRLGHSRRRDQRTVRFLILASFPSRG